MEELNVRLKMAMKEKGVKAVDICSALNIPKATLSNYMSGRIKSMTGIRLHELAKFLGVQESWLMGYDVKQMTVDEDRLLAMYRNMNEEEQKNLFAYAMYLEERR